MSGSRPPVLASGSPRRREILSQLGIDFDVIVSTVDEPSRRPDETPVQYAESLAALKARDVSACNAGRLVLGADTIVVLEGDVLGKPSGLSEARTMIQRLQGRAHEVITAVALVGGKEDETIHCQTRVWFRELSPGACERYADTGEGLDKAGAYAIQGLGAGLVARIEGSYSNVVGLPAAQVVELLQTHGGVTQWP